MRPDGSYRPVDLEGFDFTVTGGVGTLVIDRTEKRNAISRPMWRALPQIIANVDADDSIGALVITGAGGHFSAGSDIADLNVPLDDFWELNSTAEAALANSRTPTIAAITGNCVGGGTEIAAACDLRIAAPGSIFGVTAAKLGLVYPAGPTKRLAQILGDAWARYLLITASIVKFEQAEDPYRPASRCARRRSAGRPARRDGPRGPPRGPSTREVPGTSGPWSDAPRCRAVVQRPSRPARHVGIRVPDAGGLVAQLVACTAHLIESSCP